jgi:hypothetical protein
LIGRGQGNLNQKFESSALILIQSKIANQKSKIHYGEAENQRLPKAFAPDALDAQSLENRAG